MSATGRSRGQRLPATDVDSHIGLRVRELRDARGLSQTELGQAVGISFQQVQKYERGINRISAGRLLEFARLLETPLSVFFEGLPSIAEKANSDARSQIDALAHFAASREGHELLTAFAAIADHRTRRQTLRLVKALAGED